MKKLILILTVVIFFYTTHAQSVAINNDGSMANASAILDVKSTTKGILIPRMSKAEKNTIVSPASGLLIYQTTPDSIGFYYYNGSTWLWLQSANNNWSTLGNTSTDTATNFLGTINNMPLRFKLNNNWAGQWEPSKGNYAIGLNANKNISTAIFTGERNISIGNLAGSENNSAADNIAIGENALQKNTSYYNVAIGSYAMRKNISGYSNVAIGLNALDSNVSGIYNSAIGARAMQKNILGTENVAIGSSAMESNRSGGRNVALGFNAAFGSFANFDNVLIGYYCGYNAKYSSQNVGIGERALLFDTSGFQNVAIGASALRNNRNGYFNVALGADAGYNTNTFNRNIFLGYQAGYNSKSNNKLYIENSNADSTNALIYGDFADDSINLNAKVNIRDYTRLGAPTTGAPAIKMKKLTFTNGGSGAFTSVAHGLTQSKILSVSVLIFANSFNDIAPRSTLVGYEYDMYINATDVVVVNVAGNDLGIQGRLGRILITYEE